MCEAFECLPWQAEEQLEADLGIVEDIVTIREFVRIKQLVDNPNTKEHDVPKGRLTNIIAEFIAEEMQERSE